MITGSITSNREAVIHITDLALPMAGTTQATLGDGSETFLDVFEATVLWDNHERDVIVFAAEGEAFLGMSMLAGYRVTLEVEDGGDVIIEPLS